MHRLYVLTRQDIGPVYAGVQAGHAVAEYLIQHPQTPWRNSTLIYLVVENEEELNLWGERLSSEGIKFAEFKEPDIGDQKTAIATVLHEDQRTLFGNLKLLS